MSTVYTSFITANGRIRAEANASPLASQLYLPDALGTVTQTVDTTTSSNLIYRARHRAYGDRAVAVVAGVPPQNQFVGSLGVRRTGRSHAQADMRARVHSLTEGRFITQAPLWAFLSGENRYGYANQNPASNVDPQGLWPGTSKGCCYEQNGTSASVTCDKGQETVCGKLFDALEKCGIPSVGKADSWHTGADVICDILGRSQCQQAANAAGVDPVILCGAMINEHAGPSGQGPALYDLTGTFKGLGVPIGRKPWAPSYSSGGMLSLKPMHAYACYTQAMACNPGLVARLGLNDWPSTAIGTLRKISNDPVFAMRVAALCMYVSTHSQCGGNKTPQQFPITWNPGAFPKNWPRNPGRGQYSSRALCIINALSSNNPF
jgi:RHS repeat-associated protein